jgi:hypothetical protein
VGDFVKAKHNNLEEDTGGPLDIAIHCGQDPLQRGRDQASLAKIARPKSSSLRGASRKAHLRKTQVQTPPARNEIYMQTEWLTAKEAAQYLKVKHRTFLK